jgi:hypothetical protein
MNDAQKEKLVAALAKAFDLAATTCSHERQAALVIIDALAVAGFKIEPRKVAA